MSRKKSRSKGRKVHRPFLGLTWDQLHAVRNVARGFRQNKDRAFWALTQKRIPLIADGYIGASLTHEGMKVWEAMQQWRPDIYHQG